MKLRNAIALMMVMLIMTALAACAPAEITEQTVQPQQTEKITDSRPDTDRSGNPITLPEKVDSIISMAPSATSDPSGSRLEGEACRCGYLFCHVFWP